MLRDAKAEYEVIGLQYYHSGRDLLEWERDLESFNHFGKPIHITEMGFPRRSLRTQGRRNMHIGEAESVARPWSGTVNSPKRFWRTISSQSIPLLAASPLWKRSPIGTLGHDGFIRGDGTREEGYRRLMNPLARWRK